MVALAAPPQFDSPHIAREMFFQRLRGVAARRDTAGFPEVDRLLLESAHPFQRPLVDDVARRIVVLSSGRAGKTAGMRRRLLRRLVRKRGAKCLFIAKSAPAAEELMWTPLKETAAALGLDARFREDRLRMTLVKNGSTLRLVGADDTAEIDKLRGQPFDEVDIDEAASHNPERLQYLIEQAVGPRLGDYKGTLVLGGTPGALLRGFFYDLTKDYVSTKGWSFHWWNMEMAAPHVPAIANAWEEALEQKANNGWSDQHPTWLREYMGRWAADDTQMVFRYQSEKDGQPWNQWEPEKDEHGIAIRPKPKGDWHYVVGVDLGGGRTNSAGAERKNTSVKIMGDPTAIEVLAWDDGDPDKNLWHVFEFHSHETVPLRTLAKVFLGEELSTDNPGGLFGKLGWPDGMIADIGSLGGLILQELANTYGIAIEPALKKNLHDSREGMNGDLIDGRMHVIKDSVLEKQLTGLQWDIDRYGLLAKNKRQRDDAADAGCYARSIAFHLLAEQIAAPAKPESPYERVGKEREPAPSRGEYDALLQDDNWGSSEAWG